MGIDKLVQGYDIVRLLIKLPIAIIKINTNS